MADAAFRFGVINEHPYASSDFEEVLAALRALEFWERDGQRPKGLKQTGCYHRTVGREVGQQDRKVQMRALAISRIPPHRASIGSGPFYPYHDAAITRDDSLQVA